MIETLRPPLTEAQERALRELEEAPFTRCREGWKTAQGRFVPLIVLARLRQQGLVILDAAKRSAKPTLAALPVLDELAGRRVRACRVCGCTEHRACAGGCWWVGEDLCSACEGAAEV